MSEPTEGASDSTRPRSRGASTPPGSGQAEADGEQAREEGRAISTPPRRGRGYRRVRDRAEGRGGFSASRRVEQPDPAAPPAPRRKAADTRTAQQEHENTGPGRGEQRHRGGGGGGMQSFPGGNKIQPPPAPVALRVAPIPEQAADDTPDENQRSTAPTNRQSCSTVYWSLVAWPHSSSRVKIRRWEDDLEGARCRTRASSAMLSGGLASSRAPSGTRRPRPNSPRLRTPDSCAGSGSDGMRSDVEAG